MWKKLPIEFDPNTGDSKTILNNKFAKCKLDNLTRNSE